MVDYCPDKISKFKSQYKSPKLVITVHNFFLKNAKNTLPKKSLILLQLMFVSISSSIDSITNTTGEIYSLKRIFWKH